MRATLLLLLAASGCIATEASIGRSGALAGDTRGGIVMQAAATTYKETATQDISAGFGIDLPVAPHGHGSSTGLVARYAHTVAPDLRLFGRVFAGLATCQVMTCPKTSPQLGAHHVVFEGRLGGERAVLQPDSSDPQGHPGMWAGVAVVYQQVHDEMLGNGQYIGLSLDLWIGVSIGAHKPAPTR